MKNDNTGSNYTSWMAGANNTTGLEQFFEPEVLDAEDIKLIIEKEID